MCLFHSLRCVHFVGTRRKVLARPEKQVIIFFLASLRFEKILFHFETETHFYLQFPCVCSSFFPETINCLAEMNEARTAAGLAEFKPASEETQVLPQHSGTVMKISAETLWNEICKKIMVVSRAEKALLLPFWERLASALQTVAHVARRATSVLFFIPACEARSRHHSSR